MFDAGSVVGRLSLNTGNFDSAVDKSKSRLSEIGERLETTGRSASRLGTHFTLMGAVLVAPLALAFTTAGKYSIQFQSRIDDLTESFTKIQIGLAQSLLPYVDQFVKKIQDLTNKFQSLNPEVKDFWVKFTAITGLLLLATGATTKLIGNLAILGGFLAKILAYFYALVPVVKIFTTFRLAGLATDWGILAKNIGVAYPLILTTGSAFAGWKLGEWIGGITGLNEALSGPNGLFTKMFMWIEEKQLGQKVKDFFGQFVNHHGATGSWGPPEGSFDLGKIVISKRPDVFDILKAKMADFGLGFQKQLKQSIMDLSDFSKLGGQIASEMVTGMTNLFQDGFFDLLTGKLDDLKNVFANFGETLLKMLSEILARIFIYFTVIRPLVSAFPGLKPAIGFAEGIDEVPSNGLYKLHTGEQVVPRYDAGKNKGKSDLTIYNLITNDAVAAAMSGKEGENVVVNIIDRNTARGGAIKKSLKRN